MDPKQYRSVRDLSFQVKFDDGNALRLVPRITTLTPGDAPCPARLDDMKCAVHGPNKPKACTIAPIPIGMALDARFGEVPPMLKLCPEDAFSGKPLLRNGIIVDPDKKNLMLENKRENMRDLNLMAAAFNQLIVHRQRDGVERDLAIMDAAPLSIFQATSAEVIATAGIWPLIVAATGTDRIPKETAKTFVDDQIKTCERHAENWSFSTAAVDFLTEQVATLSEVRHWLN
jgi:hypothetical protein